MTGQNLDHKVETMAADSSMPLTPGYIVSDYANGIEQAVSSSTVRQSLFSTRLVYFQHDDSPRFTGIANEDMSYKSVRFAYFLNADDPKLCENEEILAANKEQNFYYLSDMNAVVIALPQSNNPGTVFYGKGTEGPVMHFDKEDRQDAARQVLQYLARGHAFTEDSSRGTLDFIDRQLIYLELNHQPFIQNEPAAI